MSSIFSMLLRDGYILIDFILIIFILILLIGLWLIWMDTD